MGRQLDGSQEPWCRRIVGQERSDDRALPGPVICQQVVGGHDGLDDLRIARDAGFGAVSLHTSRLRCLPVARWRPELDALGMAVAGYMAIRDVLDDPGGASRVIADAASFGARYVVVTTGPLRGRPASEADAICASWFERTQPVATAAGIRLAVEPLHPLLGHLSYVHTVRHARRLLRNAPGVGIVVDTAHLWWDERLVDDLALTTDDVVAVQLGDVDPASIAAGRYDRVPLGAGPVQNSELVSELRRLGYQGAFEHETLMPSRGDRARQLAGARRRIEALDPAVEDGTLL